MFKFIATQFKEVKLIRPHYVCDSRGSFIKTYEKVAFEEQGINLECYESMETISKKNVIRGLHFQKEKAQAKLVRAVSGTVYDVVVDIRPNSNSFGKWQGFYLDDKAHEMLYIPRGFAHGFLVTSEKAIFSYVILDNEYSPQDEDGIIWHDHFLKITWPLQGAAPIYTSDRDKAFKSFEALWKEGAFECNKRYLPE